MAAFVRVEGRNANEAMDATLGFGEAVSVLAFEDQGGALDAGGFALQDVADLELPTARFRPALVHAEQHVRPIARFSAAGAGVDAQNAIARVVRSIQKDLEFEGLEPLEEFRDVLLELRLNLALR